MMLPGMLPGGPFRPLRKDDPPEFIALLLWMYVTWLVVMLGMLLDGCAFHFRLLEHWWAWALLVGVGITGGTVVANAALRSLHAARKRADEPD